MITEDRDRHDALYTMGQIGPNDATLWIHSNGNPNHLLFIVCVECRGREWDFHNVAEAWKWFWEEQERWKMRERAKRNIAARKRYWKRHTTNMV